MKSPGRPCAMCGAAAYGAIAICKACKARMAHDTALVRALGKMRDAFRGIAAAIREEREVAAALERGDTFHRMGGAWRNERGHVYCDTFHRMGGAWRNERGHVYVHGEHVKALVRKRKLVVSANRRAVAWPR